MITTSFSLIPPLNCCYHYVQEDRWGVCKNPKWHFFMRRCTTLQIQDLADELNFMKHELDKLKNILKKDEKKLKDYIQLSKNYFTCYKTLVSLGQEEKSELEKFLLHE